MNSPHPFSQPISNAQKNILKGNIHFTQSKGKWTIEVTAVWNKKINKITIKARNSEITYNFPWCKIFKSTFLTLISYVNFGRTEAYSFQGEKSIFSETILKSKTTIPLMETKNLII